MIYIDKGGKTIRVRCGVMFGCIDEFCTIVVWCCAVREMTHDIQYNDYVLLVFLLDFVRAYLTILMDRLILISFYM
jgi:hypothetical protein